MTRPIFFIFICYVLFPHALGAADASETPQELKDLQSKYNADVQDAIKPIKDHYIDDLKDLLKLELNKGDVDAAALVQTEIQKMTSESSYSGTT